jgi:NADH:ubiquinone oxidoreductase subunit
MSSTDQKPDPNFSLIRRLSQLGTMIETRLYGIEVGHDDFGNRYYRARRAPKGVREKRWVIYAGEPEASKVPPEWHIWLHHTANAPISDASPLHRPWQKPYQPNMTGTSEAYLPPGHALEGGKRAAATGDYEAWQPEE